MCRDHLKSNPCWKLECPHNLFWKKLKLNRHKIHITKRAREIGNCCCLINKPWTEEEIRSVWGLPMDEIVRHEATAWKKIQKKNLTPWLASLAEQGSPA